MADRVHPRDSPLHNETAPFPYTSSPESPRKPSPPESEKPVPPPGTYVIQIPKDQVYRVPPPENATRYKNYTRQNPRRSSCRCCFCWLFGLVAALILLSAAAAAIFYLVVRPKSPNYSIDSITFRGFNLTAPSPSYAISPEIQVTVRAQNPNKKIGIYYEKKGYVQTLYCSTSTVSSSTTQQETAAASSVYVPTPRNRDLRTPHSGYHFDGTSRKFFEGWYLKVAIPERRQSFCFMYTVENPAFRKPLTALELVQNGPRSTGVGAQILGTYDKYICQYSEESQNFWGRIR